MQKIFNCESEEELHPVAKEIFNISKTKKIFAFFGNMGAGKTTLIKKICDTLNVVDNVNSPTYSLVNEYKTQNNNTIFHFDFYRIKSITEAKDMGLDEYLYSGNLCFIEWPEKIEQLLPEDTVHIRIISENNTRKIILDI